MGRWGRGRAGSKQRTDESAGAPGATADSPSPTLLQLVTTCEPDAMVEQLRSGEDGLDRLGADGWGSLHHAASLGMRGHIEALLDARANALLKTAAPSGSFPKGITALQVAQSVHKAGRGDRKAVIDILQLGIQANGWGDWRTLKATDGQRQASMASVGTLPVSSLRPKPVASTAGTQDTVSVAKLEEAVAAAEDRMRWAMRDELAARESATQLVEIQLLEAKERESGYKHRLHLMEKQLDAMSARERDAKSAAAVAMTAKDSAEKAAQVAENRVTKETVARRRAVAAAKEAQAQAEVAYARAEAAEAESAQMATKVELAQQAEAEAKAAQAAAEASRVEAQLSAQREMEHLKAMVLGTGRDGEAKSESNGPLQQVMVQVTELKERCEALSAELEESTAARVSVEMEIARLETMMHNQEAAAAAAALDAAEQAAKAFQEEVKRRLIAEELCLKTTRDLELERACSMEELERHRAEQAAQKAEALRSRHGTAAKALAKMLNRCLARAFGGWVAIVRRLQRHRSLLKRSAGRFAHGMIARAFGSWKAWADTSRQLGAAARNALEQLEKRDSDVRSIEAARAALAAQVAELKTELVKTNARHGATIARIEAEAQQERKMLRAAVRKTVRNLGPLFCRSDHFL